MLPSYLTLPRGLGTMLILASIGCRPAQPDIVDSAVTDSSPEPAGPIQRIAFFPSESNPLARYVEVTLTTPASIQLEFWVAEGPHFQKTFEEVETTHTLPLIGLHPDALNHLIVHAVSEGETIDSSETLDIETLPLDFEPPQFDVKVPMEPDGIITVFGIQTEEVEYVGVDRTGTVVWMKRTTSGANEEPAEEVTELKRNYCNAKAGHFIKALENETYLDLCGREMSGSKDLVFDVINPAGDVVEARRTIVPLHHDVDLNNATNLLGMVKQTEVIAHPDLGEVEIHGDRLVVVNSSGKIVWEWSTFDYLDPLRFPVSDQQILTGDWTHANSIQHITDSAEILVSFRNQNQVMSINPETKEITHIFGEDGSFELLQGDWFYGQHHATLGPDNTLTVFDNHYLSDDSTPSRVVQYQFDPTNQTIWEIASIDFDHAYRSGGEATPLPNGGLMITAGGLREETAPIELLETDENHQIIWKIHPEGDSFLGIYRTGRIDSGARIDG